jgi:hypothetical protein
VLKDLQQGYNVVVFHPRGVGLSDGEPLCKDDLVNDGIAQVRTLLSQNISASNIILDGHSLGAGYATLVANYFQNQDSEQLKVNLINGRSFTTLTDSVVGNIHNQGIKTAKAISITFDQWRQHLNENYPNSTNRKLLHYLNPLRALNKLTMMALNAIKLTLVALVRSFAYVIGHAIVKPIAKSLLWKTNWEINALSNFHQLNPQRVASYCVDLPDDDKSFGHVESCLPKNTTKTNEVNGEGQSDQFNNSPYYYTLSASTSMDDKQQRSDHAIGDFDDCHGVAYQIVNRPYDQVDGVVPRSASLARAVHNANAKAFPHKFYSQRMFKGTTEVSTYRQLKSCDFEGRDQSDQTPVWDISGHTLPNEYLRYHDKESNQELNGDNFRYGFFEHIRKLNDENNNENNYH